MMNKKGQESNFKTMVFAFILMSLFGMLILTAVVNVGDTYGKDTSEVVGGSLSLSKFNESISDIESDAKSLNTQFSKQSVWSSIAGVVVEGVFGIAKDIAVMILAPFSILTDIVNNIFGVPTWVTSVVLGMLIIGIVLAIWRLVKIGD